MKVTVTSAANSVVSMIIGGVLYSLLLRNGTETGVANNKAAAVSGQAGLIASTQSSVRSPRNSQEDDSPVEKSSRNVSFSSEWGVLPAASFYGLPFNLLIPGRLKIAPNRLALIGINEEKAVSVNEILENLERKILGYEEKAVSRRSGKDGEFYFIPASKELATERENSVAAIRNLFVDSPPAGESLLSVLFHGSAFSSFGVYNEEISIRDKTVGGVPQTVIETLYSDPGNPHLGTMRGKNVTLDANVVTTRYPFFGKK